MNVRAIGQLITSMVLAFSTAPGVASIVTFSDRETFDAATGPQRLVDFEQYALGSRCPNTETYEPCIWNAEGITFVSTVPMSRPFQRPLLSIDYFGGSLSRGLLSNEMPREPSHFYWEFTAHYMGLDIIAAVTDNEQYILSLVDALENVYEFSVSTVWESGAFFGFLSDTPIRRMSVYEPCTSGSCYNFLIDNVAYGTVGEPPTGLLLVAAAVAFTVVAGRNSRGKGCRARKRVNSSIS